MTSFGQLADLDDDALRVAYAPPRLPWLRLNFVATVDGAVSGGDGTSGSINNEADHRVFGALRAQADVVVAGAGTIRDEGYRPNPKPLVVVTRSGEIPPTLLEGDTGRVYVATGARAPGLADARSVLGDRVLVLGEDAPDPVALRSALVDLGFANMLCEGGPHLARDLLAAGVVDELCCTLVPTLVAGSAPRITVGDGIDVPLALHALLEDAGTLLGRWLVSPVHR
ncbi:dihydrofolate reductase family protein [Nocardioides cynanchi]|uniref:dihydrofolate reductase family protein n=1 Tax=Nocardioides cynanchi TaxID=2558918 RepID=UPI001EE266B2|nr:dihydrofolate reductase family protein [Nocardioides cynanchi]